MQAAIKLGGHALCFSMSVKTDTLAPILMRVVLSYSKMFASNGPVVQPPAPICNIICFIITGLKTFYLGIILNLNITRS